MLKRNFMSTRDPAATAERAGPSLVHSSVVHMYSFLDSTKSRVCPGFDLQSQCHENNYCCSVGCALRFDRRFDRLYQGFWSGCVFEREGDWVGFCVAKHFRSCAAKAAGIFRSGRYELWPPRRARGRSSTQDGQRVRPAGQPGQARFLRRLRHARDDRRSGGQCSVETLHSAVARDGLVGCVDQRRLSVAFARRRQWTSYLLCSRRYGFDGSRAQRRCRPSRHGKSSRHGIGESASCSENELKCQRDEREQAAFRWRRCSL